MEQLAIQKRPGMYLVNNPDQQPANIISESLQFPALKELYDVVIIGGGPAGLNAAVVLGRCRRSVIVFDTAKQRNRLSHGMHNYLTRDGIRPADFLEFSKKEARKYGVTLLNKEVVHAEKTKQGRFIVKDNSQKIYYCKKLLIATGTADNVPAIDGIQSLYGRSVFHCPYCDAWEVKDRVIGVYAKNKNGTPLATSLKTWTNNVTLYCDGRNYLDESKIKVLKRLGIPVISRKIKSLEGKDGQLRNIIFVNGEKSRCDALFFVNGQKPQSDIIKKLGCAVNNKNIALTNRMQQTNIAGVYIAGDVSKDMHFVVVAAAEGAKAGVSINKELQAESLL
jgi:thioredoxin reductase